MYALPYTRRTRGMGLIDIIVGVALISLVFSGIVAGMRFALELISVTRAQEGALSIANDQIELIRSLSYDAVGTEGGIPAGAIPQEQEVTLNKITYTKRVFIQYVDAPEDGLDQNDENGVTADYKRARVEVAWTNHNKEYEEVLVTNIVPRGIETSAGGGTLRINVFDAPVTPVADASVHVVNTSISPEIDVTTYTNTEGVAFFSGAPTSSGYQITATKNGHSQAQTYSVSADNPNPNPGHITVAENQTSSISFFIDRLSTSTISTVEPVEPATSTDTFTDASGLSQSNNTTVSGGALALSTSGGGYAQSGSARSTAIAPTLLDSWNAVTFTDTTSADTEVVYQVFYEDAGGVAHLVPDEALPENSSGFTESPIDIGGLDSEVYDTLFLEASLTTDATSTTPSVEDWAVTYFVGPTPVPNVAFTLRGAKTIGTEDGGQPVYKYEVEHTTDGDGIATIGGLEWDIYDVRIDGASEGYDIAKACPALPFSLQPDTASSTVLTLVSHTSDSLRVTVTDPGGDPLDGATARLTRGAYDETRTTGACGQVFFTGLTTAADYTLETDHASYAPDTQQVNVSGATTLDVALSP